MIIMVFFKYKQKIRKENIMSETLQVKIAELTNSETGNKTIIGVMFNDRLIRRSNSFENIPYIRNRNDNPITLREPNDNEKLVQVSIEDARPGDVIVFNGRYGAQEIQDVNDFFSNDNKESIGIASFEVFDPNFCDRLYGEHEAAITVIPKEMLGDAFPVFRLPESMR